MNKIVRFTHMYFSMFLITGIVLFGAIIGSVYGFSKVIHITSPQTQIPPVNTFKELPKENIVISPTITQLFNKAEQTIAPTIKPENGEDREEDEYTIEKHITPTITPIEKYDEDEDIEDVSEERDDASHELREEERREDSLRER